MKYDLEFDKPDDGASRAFMRIGIVDENGECTNVKALIATGSMCAIDFSMLYTTSSYLNVRLPDGTVIAPIRFEDDVLERYAPYRAVLGLNFLQLGVLRMQGDRGSFELDAAAEA